MRKVRFLKNYKANIALINSGRARSEKTIKNKLYTRLLRSPALFKMYYPKFKKEINKIFDTLTAYRDRTICEMDAITLLWQSFKKIDKLSRDEE